MYKLSITASLLTLYTLLPSGVEAINDYRKCLQCIHEKFEEKFYYCDELGGSCRAQTDSRCDLANIKIDYEDCVQGFSQCTDKLFSNGDFLVRESYNQTLVPGFGCYIEIDRTLNGTWGQLRIKAKDKQAQADLLVFDDSLDVQETGLAQYLKGLYYTDNGWLGRKVFIVNSAESRPSTFSYTYEAAKHLAAVTFASIAMMVSVELF